MKKTVSEQIAKAKLDIEDSLLPKGKTVVRHLSLPSQGQSLDWVLEEMKSMDSEMGGNIKPWDKGKISGAVYRTLISQKFKRNLTISPDGGEDLEKIIVAAMSRYYLSNPIHPDIFPAVRKMEAEIVAMVLKLYHAPEGAAGTMTSGGTESIIMAMKTYRDWARTVKGIREPEM
jgi:sphinganine-1-phosphate aldolase